MKSYLDLEIYKLAIKLSIEIHHLSLKLPQFEKYEIGSQIRRSSKSVSYNIVEGYGRRRYKNEFIKFLVYSYASCLETNCQLEYISMLYPEKMPANIIANFDHLGRKIYFFIKYVEKNWK